MKGKSDLILAAVIAASLHGMLFGFFPREFTPPRLELKEVRPLRVSLLAPVPSRPAQAVTAPEPPSSPREKIKKVGNEKTNPVKKGIRKMEPRDLPEPATREKPEALPPRETVAAVSRDAGPPEKVPAPAASKNPDREETSGLIGQEARYRYNPPPPYPSLARRRGYEGTVFLLVEVLPGGSAGRIRIRKSSGFPLLDQAALKAVGRWRFEPALENGTARTSWVEVPIRFILGSL